MNFLKKLLMIALALALIIASPVSAGIEILGGSLRLGGGGIQLYQPTTVPEPTESTAVLKESGTTALTEAGTAWYKE